MWEPTGFHIHYISTQRHTVTRIVAFQRLFLLSVGLLYSVHNFVHHFYLWFQLLEYTVGTDPTVYTGFWNGSVLIPINILKHLKESILVSILVWTIVNLTIRLQNFELVCYDNSNRHLGTTIKTNLRIVP